MASLMRSLLTGAAVLLLVFGALVAPSPAQTLAPLRAGDTSPDLNQSAIDRKIRETESRKDIDAESRTKIVEIYRSVRNDLDRIDEVNAQAAQSQKVEATGQAEIARIERGNAAMKAALDGPVDLVAETALESDELAKLLESAQAKQATLKNDLATKEQALLRRTERIPAAKEELRDAQAAILDLKKELAGMGGEGGTALGEARLTALRAALLLKQAQVPALTAELAAQPNLLSLAQHQRDAARLELALSERRVKALDELVGKRRIADAEATQQEAERALQESATKHPVLRELAEWKSRLSAERARLATEIRRVETQRDAFIERADRIEARDASLRQRLRDDNLSRELRARAARGDHPACTHLRALSLRAERRARARPAVLRGLQHPGAGPAQRGGRARGREAGGDRHLGRLGLDAGAVGRRQRRTRWDFRGRTSSASPCRASRRAKGTSVERAPAHDGARGHRGRDRYPAGCQQMLRTSVIRFAEGEPVYRCHVRERAGGRAHRLSLPPGQPARRLVVGTGDLRGAGAGRCTYGVGDHMSHYHVNAVSRRPSFST